MSLSSNRRLFLKHASVTTASLAWVRQAFGAARGALPGASVAPDVYGELGVATMINGQGTLTVLGGSIMPEEVHTAMAAASRNFVSLPELHEAAGKRIAELLKLPAGYSALVTSGAAAALTLGTAAVMTGDRQECIRRLPDTTGMKSEVIIQKSHRYAFDQQIRACGIKFVEVETRDDVRRVAGPNTALMFFTNYANAAGKIKVDEWPRLARELKVPSFNDAAADTPPISHLWDYVNMGYDLVTFSGGKAIRGPQCAGLLLGRKELIACAAINGCPHEDTLGRGMKVGREEIVGMVKALELYLKADHEALTREWWRRLDYIGARVKKVPGTSTSFFVPDIANHVPHMEITWDPRQISLAPERALTQLKNSKPSILLSKGEHGIAMNSFQLQPGEERIIADRLVEILRT